MPRLHIYFICRCLFQQHTLLKPSGAMVWGLNECSSPPLPLALVTRHVTKLGSLLTCLLHKAPAAGYRVNCKGREEPSCLYTLLKTEHFLKSQWALMEIQEIPLKHMRLTVRTVKSWNRNREYVEDILNNLVDIQNPTGHSSEHSALTDPALRSWGWTRRSPELPSYFNCSANLSKQSSTSQPS